MENYIVQLYVIKIHENINAYNQFYPSKCVRMSLKDL